MKAPAAMGYIVSPAARLHVLRLLRRPCGFSSGYESPLRFSPQILNLLIRRIVNSFMFLLIWNGAVSAPFLFFALYRTFDLAIEAAPLPRTLIVHPKIYTFDPAFYICPLAVRKARFVGASPMALKWAQPCT